MAQQQSKRGKVLVLDEQRKREFKKDMQKVFRKYGFESGFWMCADANPVSKQGTTIYMGHTNPLGDRIRDYAEAVSAIMRAEVEEDPI